MTKRQTIRTIRDIMSGRSGHTYIAVRAARRGYVVETGVGNPVQENHPGAVLFRHDRNDMTLKEAQEHFGERMSGRL